MLHNTVRQVDNTKHCSASAPRSRAAKQWFEQLAQKRKNTKHGMANLKATTLFCWCPIPTTLRSCPVCFSIKDATFQQMTKCI